MNAVITKPSLGGVLDQVRAHVAGRVKLEQLPAETRELIANPVRVLTDLLPASARLDDPAAAFEELKLYFRGQISVRKLLTGTDEIPDTRRRIPEEELPPPRDAAVLYQEWLHFRSHEAGNCE